MINKLLKIIFSIFNKECNHKYIYHKDNINNYYRVCRKCYFISYYTKFYNPIKNKYEYVWMKMNQYTKHGANKLLNELKLIEESSSDNNIKEYKI